MKAISLFDHKFLSLALLALILQTQAAHAYIGPGLGLGTIAVVLGVIGSVFLAVFAVLWYPIKRMLKKKKAPDNISSQQAQD